MRRLLLTLVAVVVLLVVIGVGLFASGKPIEDAEVSVQFFMPAMPTMNMPAMRSGAKLSPAGGGMYRGAAQVMMAGRWDATVTVTRGGQRLGTKHLPVVAR